MNLKKILIILLIIIVVIVVAVYVMGMFEQTKPIADSAVDLGNQAVDYMQKNIPTVVAAGGTVTALGGVALSKISAAKQQTEQVTTAANSQISGLLSEKDKIADNLKTAETELGSTKDALTQATDLKAAAETKASELETANKNLTGKLDGMTEMHNNFVAQLTSGAQTVIDPATNQTYKLITLEKTLVK